MSWLILDQDGLRAKATEIRNRHNEEPDSADILLDDVCREREQYSLRRKLTGRERREAASLLIGKTGREQVTEDALEECILIWMVEGWFKDASDSKQEQILLSWLAQDLPGRDVTEPNLTDAISKESEAQLKLSRAQLAQSKAFVARCWKMKGAGNTKDDSDIYF